MMNKMLAVMALTMTAYASTIQPVDPSFQVSPYTECNWNTTIGKHWEQGIQDRFQTGRQDKCKVKLQTPFHILSINGEGSKAQIPANVISKMESEAFTLADSIYSSFPDKKSKTSSTRINMSNIFDMITGTGSGSIVAAGLSYGKDPLGTT